MHETVASLDRLITEKYFNMAAIPRVHELLVKAERDGEYATSADATELAKRLTDTLATATYDKHLFVLRTYPAGTGQVQSSLSRAEKGRMDNYGLKRAEILPGNVGYLEVTSFYRATEGAAALETAMNLVSHADAFILDFRKNSGGSPDTAVQLLSYFFQQTELPLFSVVPRSGDSTLSRTQSQGVSFQDEARPVYVLVSASTWSAGEAVAFILQERHRAIIVGEQTAGAANPAGPWPLNDSLAITIPFGQIVTTVRKTNWERSGVSPDITVLSREALKQAYIGALTKLMKASTDPLKKAILSEALAAASASFQVR